MNKFCVSIIIQVTYIFISSLSIIIGYISQNDKCQSDNLNLSKILISFGILNYAFLIGGYLNWKYITNKTVIDYINRAYILIICIYAILISISIFDLSINCFRENILLWTTGLICCIFLYSNIIIYIILGVTHIYETKAKPLLS